MGTWGDSSISYVRKEEQKINCSYGRKAAPPPQDAPVWLGSLCTIVAPFS